MHFSGLFFFRSLFAAPCSSRVSKANTWTGQQILGQHAWSRTHGFSGRFILKLFPLTTMHLQHMSLNIEYFVSFLCPHSLYFPISLVYTPVWSCFFHNVFIYFPFSLTPSFSYSSYSHCGVAMGTRKLNQEGFERWESVWWAEGQTTSFIPDSMSLPFDPRWLYSMFSQHSSSKLYWNNVCVFIMSNEVLVLSVKLSSQLCFLLNLVQFQHCIGFRRSIRARCIWIYISYFRLKTFHLIHTGLLVV